MPKKFWPFIIGSVIAVIALPLAIDWLIIGNNFPSNISNSEWVGFFGGYIGSVLGCVISLIGILWTINFTREQNRADRELQIRPYLDIRYIPLFNESAHIGSWLGYVMINEQDENDTLSRDMHRGILYLKNVGNGPATNISVNVSVGGIAVKYWAGFSNQNTKVTTNSVQQGKESAISFIITNNRIAPSKNDLIWHECGLADYDHEKFSTPSNYSITVTLQYNDLLGNLFAQVLKFETSYGMSYNKENGAHYQCDLNLLEKGVPQKKQ